MEALALLFDMAPAEEVDRYHGDDVHVTRRWLNCVSSQDATSATFSRLCRRASSVAMQRSDADGTGVIGSCARARSLKSGLSCSACEEWSYET